MQGLNYYLTKITSQYRSSPNLIAWLAANLQPFQDVQACLAQFTAAFSLDTAVGAQLDTLGAIIGQPRTVAFQPSSGVSPVLDDETYRILLTARVSQNHWDGKIGTLISLWQMIFPGGLLIVDDLQNMTVNLYVAAATTSILRDLILNGYIIPRPQGVLYNITLATLPMFGFDRSDSFVAGFDGGHFI